MHIHCWVYILFCFFSYIHAKSSINSQSVTKGEEKSIITVNLRNKTKNRPSMPKLYFRHGAVSSAKSMNLLAVAHSYRAQGKSVILMKPAMDTRFGADVIKSRAGLEKEADVLITPSTNILTLKPDNVHCVLVDESQFLSPKHIEQLRKITAEWRVPVICYGLRTDFRTNLFPGSKRLMELADNVEEIKTTCFFCNRKAVYNLKHVNGIADVEGPAVQLGSEEKYFPACFECYQSALMDIGQDLPSACLKEDDIEVTDPIMKKSKETEELLPISSATTPSAKTPKAPSP